MPNHTATLFRISGPQDEILRFIEKGKNSEQQLNIGNFLPTPAELLTISSPIKIQTQEEIDKLWEEWRIKKANQENSGPMGIHSYNENKPFGLGITAQKYNELIEKYGAPDWFEWNVANWGTKWDVYHVGEWFIEEGKASINFDTAWSPASRAWVTISKEFPNLEFYHEYADEGGSFVGYETIKNGEVLDEEDFEWDSEDGIEIRKNVGYYSEEDENEEISSN